MSRRGFTHDNGIQAPNIGGHEYPCTFFNQPMGGSGDPSGVTAPFYRII